MALAGPIPASSAGRSGYGNHSYTPTMEEQLVLFARRHDFTTCPPSPSRLMPRRLALPSSPSPTHSPALDRRKAPMFITSSTSATKTANHDARECEQSAAQTAMEMLEAHLHSVLPLPSTSSLSSLASFSSLFVSPQSSPTISRLLSSSPSPSSPSSPSSFLSSFSSSPCVSPSSSPSTFAPSKLSRAMKKHVRPSKEEKEYFKHLFSQHHRAKRKSKKSSSGKKKDKDAAMKMDEDDVDEWREQLEQFEVSKYFVGSASTSSSRARWQAALMLAYRDANKLSSSADTSNRSCDSRQHKRRSSKREEELQLKKNDVYGNRDRGDELQAAARLVVEMNHLWDLANRLMLGKLDVAHLRRAKESATWTLIDLPSPSSGKAATTTESAPLSPTSSSKCDPGDKLASFRFTLMSSIGYFANSVLPSSPTSPPCSPSLLADAPPKRRPSLVPAGSATPPSLDETIFGCPSFPSTPGTVRLRPRPRPDEEEVQQRQSVEKPKKVTIVESEERRQPHQLSVAEGEVVALLLADLLVKQMSYELCLSGTLSRAMADAQ